MSDEDLNNIKILLNGIRADVLKNLERVHAITEILKESDTRTVFPEKGKIDE